MNPTDDLQLDPDNETERLADLPIAEEEDRDFDLPKPGHLDRVQDARPGLLDRLRDALTSKRAQLERIQREAEADDLRLANLASELNCLESDCQHAKEEIAKLDAEHQRLTGGRPGWLEACRKGWRMNNYNGSMMAEIDFMLADYPAHHALLVERLKAAEAAFKAFKRQHSL